MVAGVRQIFISKGLDTHIKSTSCIWITGQAWQNVFVVKQKKMESILIYDITIYLESNEVMCVTISLCECSLISLFVLITGSRKIFHCDISLMAYLQN